MLHIKFLHQHQGKLMLRESIQHGSLVWYRRPTGRTNFKKLKGPGRTFLKHGFGKLLCLGMFHVIHWSPASNTFSARALVSSLGPGHGTDTSSLGDICPTTGNTKCQEDKRTKYNFSEIWIWKTVSSGNVTA